MPRTLAVPLRFITHTPSKTESLFSVRFFYSYSFTDSTIKRNTNNNFSVINYSYDAQKYFITSEHIRGFLNILDSVKRIKDIEM